MVDVELSLRGFYYLHLNINILYEKIITMVDIELSLRGFN